LKTLKVQQMPKLVWDESYATKIKAFDEQHEVIFTYINDLRDAMMGKKSEEIVNRTLKGLLQYSVTHFIEEEIVLLKYDYPDFDSHQKSHQKFTEEVRRLFVEYKSGKANSRIIAAEITAIVTEWLQIHILQEDFAYTEFLMSKGIQ